ncbi:hypothetical protein QYE76_028336 [Lolium multiflorum]|uniref:Transposase (putative) gypsy type domain-containing protein n=1 Tax=Lolium multiflorum TaxID=4521 RepID=A0AAD8QPC3_LOLMU|nr:hypothetical protein QYE76_028336 [Lolium multiflorum]
MPSSSAEPGNGVATAAFEASSPEVDERLVSSLRTQAEVDFLCKKHGVPSVYTARPAGADRRACTPPPGSLCVYAHALEAGMRVPLHGFFCEVLAHFGIAPSQLVPNGWRVMAGFLALCRSVGMPPSLAVFRRFFLLVIVNSKLKGWYCFRARDSLGLRFTGLPNTPMDWKKMFFFLSSPEPWPCPVEWGEPSMSSFVNPVLTREEERSAKKLLDAYCGGGGAVDIKTCLCDGKLAGSMVTATSTPPPPPASASTCITSSSKGSKGLGMDPSVYSMMKTMLAERAAAQATASTRKVKAEPGSNAPFCGNKRNLEQANGEEGAPPSVLTNTPLPGPCPLPPPGFSRKPRHFPSRHGGDTTKWEAARELLQGAVGPPQERVFAASEPSEVVRSSYAAILEAVNYTTFSLSYALELEEKLVARDAEVAALRAQLDEAKAKLAAVKRPAGEAELKKAERESAGTAAVQHPLGSEEHAVEGCERWRGRSRRTAPMT